MTTMTPEELRRRADQIQRTDTCRNWAGKVVGRFTTAEAVTFAAFLREQADKMEASDA